MASDASEQNDHPQPAPRRVLTQIEHCLRQGCVLCIEHSELMGPRFSPWEIWGTPACYNGDVGQVVQEIENCRTRHHDHFIRLNIEDYSCHARFSFVVHAPDNPV